MTDLKIAQGVELHHINTIAAKLNISEDDLEQYGKYKAKLPLNLIDENKVENSNLILVTALTPTPAGEGKTTVSIGLNEGLTIIRTSFWNKRWCCRWWILSSSSHGRH
jgi:formate--tetrahydrofolate ligase